MPLDENYRKGFRLIYKSMFNHPLVGAKKPYTRRDAWEWMIFEACWKKEGREVMRQTGKSEMMIREEYGEFVHSIRFMARAWGWGDQKVRTFIKQLSATNPPMLTLNLTHNLTKIFICNYSTYQNPKQAKQRTDNEPITNRQRTDNTNYNIYEHINNTEDNGSLENIWNEWQKIRAEKKRPAVSVIAGSEDIGKIRELHKRAGGNMDLIRVKMQNFLISDDNYAESKLWPLWLFVRRFDEIPNEEQEDFWNDES